MWKRHFEFYFKVPFFNLKVVLYTVDYPYFKYNQTLNKEISTRDNPFAEPTIVYNNIESGIGIFGGYAIDSVAVDLW